MRDKSRFCNRKILDSPPQCALDQCGNAVKREDSYLACIRGTKKKSKERKIKKNNPKGGKSEEKKKTRKEVNHEHTQNPLKYTGRESNKKTRNKTKTREKKMWNVPSRNLSGDHGIFREKEQLIPLKDRGKEWEKGKEKATREREKEKEKGKENDRRQESTWRKDPLPPFGTRLANMIKPHFQRHGTD